MDFALEVTGLYSSQDTAVVVARVYWLVLPPQDRTRADTRATAEVLCRNCVGVTR
ncbi:hypothetical protein [Microlunatus ginsengisoli]|uniref:Uncharacterized protein n=1 Tax=Microlunatus ginsengisoli TaxID=363863 RepID=A0ABP6ZK65_9ACTN